MALKKREKVLSPEELKEKMKKDLSQFWFNSEVLFGNNLFPVAESFSKEITILFLLDFADFTTERIGEFVSGWNTRYAKLPWTAVIAFQQKYAFLKSNKFMDRHRNQKVFLDTFGDLFERFGSGKEPVAVIFKSGQFISSMPLLPDLSSALFQVEKELQKVLRAEDQGLPLPIIEKWRKKNAPMEQQSTGAGQVTTSGTWTGSDTMIYSEDNNTTISIPFKGKMLRMVAMAHPNALETVKAQVTFNDKPIYKDVQGPLVHEDNTGITNIDINKTTGIYDLIISEHEMTGIVKLTFLNVYDVGVIFYEFKSA